MMIKERFMKELKIACREEAVQYGKIRELIDVSLKDEEILSFYITLGSSPKFPDTLLDVLVLTKSLIYNFEVKKTEAGMNVFRLENFWSLAEETKKDWVYINFFFNQIGSVDLVLYDKIGKINKMRDFIYDVKKQAWRK